MDGSGRDRKAVRPPVAGHGAGVSDLLMKEAIATYFRDLYMDGYLPRAWFHDIFCRNLPITRLAWDRLGTGSVTRATLTESAMRRFPAMRRAQHRRQPAPAGR